MSISTADAVNAARGLIAELIVSVPAGVCPYPTIAEEVGTLFAVSPPEPEWFLVTLKVHFWLLIASLPLPIALLANRIRHGNFWLFRLVKRTHGTYLSPNVLTIWLILCMIHTMCMVFFVRYIWMGALGHTLPTAVPYYGLSYVFAPMYSALGFAVWSMALGAILTRDSLGRRRFLPPFVVHIMAFGLVAAPIFAPLATIPQASKAFSAVQATLSQVVALLQDATAKFDGAIDHHVTETVIPLVASLISNSLTVWHSSQFLLPWAYTGVDIYLLLCAIPTSYFFIDILRVQRQRLRAWRKDVALGVVSENMPSAQESLSSFRRACCLTAAVFATIVQYAVNNFIMRRLASVIPTRANAVMIVHYVLFCEVTVFLVLANVGNIAMLYVEHKDGLLIRRAPAAHAQEESKCAGTDIDIRHVEAAVCLGRESEKGQKDYGNDKQVSQSDSASDRSHPQIV